jgi:transposase InsO family protein
MPNLASVSKPLRDLTAKKAVWNWSTDEEAAFTKIKEIISSTKTLEYFNTAATTELYVDAGPNGLGSVLMQRVSEHEVPKPIAYASRSLTATEGRYSQLEKEMLAIIWACEHFHLYVYGAPITIFSDHKPLVQIFANPYSMPSARIERWHLRMQAYDYKVKHIPGLQNPADFLSRHLCSAPPADTNQAMMAQIQVNMLVNDAVPKAVSLHELQEATSADSALQKVKISIMSNIWTKDKETQPFYAIRNELVVDEENKVILRGHRLVVPTTLQQRVVQIAHSSHQGETKTKALLREKVWFPKMDTLVVDNVRSCIACQATTTANAPTLSPLQMTPLPPGPWQHVAVDFLGPVLDSRYLMVVIDEYSRYPVVCVLKTTAATAVLPHLKEVFAMFGTPTQVKSDNGPPFSSEAFAQFAKEQGFHHQKITPYWPNANAEAERFMKPLMKALRTAQVLGKPWKDHLTDFLKGYRNTPHPSTGQAPTSLLLGRQVQTGLPQLNPKLDESEVRARDNQAKAKMKAHTDKRLAERPNFQPGDKVLVRQQRLNKMSTPYNPKPYTIDKVKGTMITASSGDHSITRNQSFFKLLKGQQVFQQPQEPGDAPIPAILPQGRRRSTQRQQATLSQNLCDFEEDPASVPLLPPPTGGTVPHMNNRAQQCQRQSTRTVKPPSYLKDYHT